MPYPTALNLPHGSLSLPIFLPDATRAVVRSLDSADLIACGVEGLVMSAFHLMQQPGSSTVKALGGLHAMTNWQRLIITDSGGFQIYSLIRQNPRMGSLSNKGATFQLSSNGRKINLTPEKSIQLQMRFGADVLICLDDCTHVDDPPAEQAESVRRTVAWAKRCKAEFTRLLESRKDSASRPLLFAVVQGGGDPALRKACAEELLAVGFDGYGYGGFPLDGKGNLLREMLALTRELIPPEFPMHALGVGQPVNVRDCARLGYQLFDSAMPTRDARHGRLYHLTSTQISGTGWLEYLYIGDAKHIKTALPLDEACDCPACRLPLGYLHHLYKIKDTLFTRLATLHNLRTMTRLIALLRQTP
jgi:queuine tRNA-ribosyltransferase